MNLFFMRHVLSKARLSVRASVFCFIIFLNGYGLITFLFQSGLDYVCQGIRWLEDGMDDP